MRQILKIILLLFLPISTYGQTVKLTGVVIDSLAHVGLPAVNMTLIQGNSVISITKTDFEGCFDFENIEPGTYQRKIKTIGYPVITINYF